MAVKPKGDGFWLFGVIASATISLGQSSSESQALNAANTLDIVVNFRVKANPWDRIKNFKSFGFPKNWGHT